MPIGKYWEQNGKKYSKMLTLILNCVATSDSNIFVSFCNFQILCNVHFCSQNTEDESPSIDRIHGDLS